MESYSSQNRGFERLSSEIISRYSSRYRKLGYNVKTLGWGTKEQQLYRFSQVINSGISFKGKKIVDIGCGFGDFLDFLIENKIEFGEYLGIDINPDLVFEANSRHAGLKGISFLTLDIFDSSQLDTPIAGDIGIMLGVLNLNLKSINEKNIDNFYYSKKMILNAFSLCSEILVVDFLSSHMNPNYDKEDFVFYHDPARTLDYCLSLSSYVSLIHNYEPIPQKEFLILMEKRKNNV